MPYNKSFIDKATLVNMAGYWPSSLFAFLWTSTSPRARSIIYTYCNHCLNSPSLNLGLYIYIYIYIYI